MNTPTIQIPPLFSPGALLKQLAHHEGYRADPYKCSKGKWTVAIGRNIEAKPLTVAELQDLQPLYEATDTIHKDLDKTLAFLERYPVDEETAYKWLAADIQEFVDGCVEDYPGFADYPTEAQNALVDMSYNMGRYKMRKFINMNAAIARGDWENAAVEALDSEWAREDVAEWRSSAIADLFRGAALQ